MSIFLYHELHETIEALLVNLSQLSLSDQNAGITEVDVGVVAELKVGEFWYHC